MSSMTDRPAGTIPSHVQQHFSSQRRSGLSIKAYCVKHGIGVSTFHFWRKRYGTAPSEQSSVPRFDHVGVFALRGAVVCDVEFGGGVRVSVHSGASTDELASVLGVIRRMQSC